MQHGANPAIPGNPPNRTGRHISQAQQNARARRDVVDVASSNLTTSHFLGVNQRPWMRNTTTNAATGVTANSSSRLATTSRNERYGEPDTGRVPSLAIPNGLHSDKGPQIHRFVSVSDNLNTSNDSFCIDVVSDIINIPSADMRDVGNASETERLEIEPQQAFPSRVIGSSPHLSHSGNDSTPRDQIMNSLSNSPLQNVHQNSPPGQQNMVRLHQRTPSYPTRRTTISDTVPETNSERDLVQRGIVSEPTPAHIPAASPTIEDSISPASRLTISQSAGPSTQFNNSGIPRNRKRTFDSISAAQSGEVPREAEKLPPNQPYTQRHRPAPFSSPGVVSTQSPLFLGHGRVATSSALSTYHPPQYVLPSANVHHQDLNEYQPPGVSVLSAPVPRSSVQAIHNGNNIAVQSPNDVSHDKTRQVSGSTADHTALCQSYLTSLNVRLQELMKRPEYTSRLVLSSVPWLREACQNSDTAFLLIHQLLCMWFVNNKNLEAIVPRFAGHSGAFTILQLFFNIDHRLPSSFVSFLATWPFPAKEIHQMPRSANLTLPVVEFLKRLQQRWNQTRQSCFQRGYPPSACEMLSIFQCTFSLTLPRILFSSLNTQIRPNVPDAFGSACFRHFVDDQHRCSLNRLLAANVTERAKSAQAFAAGYDDLLQQFLGFKLGNYPFLVDNPVAIDTRNLYALPGTQSANDAMTTTMSAAAVSRRAEANVTYRPTNPIPRPQNILTTNIDHMLASRVPLRTNAVNHGVQTVSRQNAQSTSNRPIPLTSNGSVTLSSTLLPLPGAPLPQSVTNPNYMQEALHQSHLIPPTMIIDDMTTPGKSRLYQFLETCLVQPRLFTIADSYFSIDFNIDRDNFARRALATGSRPDTDDIPHRKLNNNSVVFNLRCVQIGSKLTQIGESAWAAMPTYWPEHIFISINGIHTEIRRKRQHVRDLPIDVTEFIREGQNTIITSIHGNETVRSLTFALTCEIIAFRDAEQVTRLPQKLSADESLARLTQSMKLTDADDDDMQVMTDSITISIIDPISLQLYDTPVRGMECLHRECFSLDTFFASRTCDFGDVVTSERLWLCPHCKKDARPSSLIIDGFMQEVRDKIQSLDASDAKAIIVKEGGSWSIKHEVEADDTKPPVTKKMTSSNENQQTSLVRKVTQTATDDGLQVAEVGIHRTLQDGQPATSDETTEIIEID